LKEEGRRKKEEGRELVLSVKYTAALFLLILTQTRDFLFLKVKLFQLHISCCSMKENSRLHEP